MLDRMAFWATIAVVVLVLYVASIGPWFWLNASGRLPALVIWTQHIYDPLRWTSEQSPAFRKALSAYLVLWLPAEPMEYHGE